MCCCCSSVVHRLSSVIRLRQVIGRPRSSAIYRRHILWDIGEEVYEVKRGTDRVKPVSNVRIFECKDSVGGCNDSKQVEGLVKQVPRGRYER